MSDPNTAIENHEREIDDLRGEEGTELQLPRLCLDRRDFMRAGAAVGAMGSLAGCTGLLDNDDGNGVAAADEDHHVPPGELDEYYAFLSGGHSGDVRVYGLPSMRQIMRIPVFNVESARGYGHDDRTSEMLEEAGDYTWGDTHHPRLSQTDNDYDGRFLYVNDKANGRMARVDLKYFETDAIVDIPNQQGTHGACARLPDTDLIFGVGEFRVPIPNDGRDVDNPEEYGSVLTAIDPDSFDVVWQVRVDGNLDNGDGGKNGRWFFSTGYNSEEGLTESEMARPDRDWVKAFDTLAIEEAVANGEYEEINGVPVVDGRQDAPLNQGNPIVHYIPVPKSPHGISVTPDGRYAIASGKLDPTCSVIEIDVHYNPGHLIAAESYTAEPQGDWLIVLNKLSKDRFLPVGPIHPENDQLIYIGDDEEGMRLVKDTPAYPEPHDASIVHRDKLDPAKVWDPEDYDLEFVGAGDEGVERTDDGVHVRMYSMRNEFGLPEFTVQEGEEVTITVSNIETTDDIIHSLAIPEYDVNVALAPQDTRQVTFTADKPGVYWVYCAYFCSALHLEMRSRMLVEPAE
jgi:nitrous-oxide reductase